MFIRVIVKKRCFFKAYVKVYLFKNNIKFEEKLNDWNELKY